MTMREATEALTALGAKVGLKGLAFDRDKVCQLVVGDDLEVELEEMADGTLRLNANVRDLADADAAVMRELLVANFNGEGTGRAALAINPASAEIVLTQAVEPRRHDADSFVAEVELFVRYAAFWQEHAAGRLAGSEDGMAPGHADGEMTIRL